jgi:hypothetical protein
MDVSVTNVALEAAFTLQEADTSKNMTMNLAELLVGQGLVTEPTSMRYGRVSWKAGDRAII